MPARSPLVMRAFLGSEEAVPERLHSESRTRAGPASRTYARHQFHSHCDSSDGGRGDQPAVVRSCRIRAGAEPGIPSEGNHFSCPCRGSVRDCSEVSRDGDRGDDELCRIPGSSLHVSQVSFISFLARFVAGPDHRVNVVLRELGRFGKGGRADEEV